MYNNYRDPKWVGEKFGMLTVLGATHHVSSNGCKEWFWEVECDCGNTKVMKPHEIINGKIVSCGCYRLNRPSLTKRHGESHTRLHDTWCGINNRCKSDPHYAGRGIGMCDEWLEYEAFRDWALASGYSDNLTIERIDVNGDYCPENCKWIPLAQQARNRTTTHWVEYDGEKMSLAEAAERAGLPYKQVHARIKSGWSEYDALHTPLRK